jgi:hypothetical protein
MKKYIQLLVAAAFLVLTGTAAQAQCTFPFAFGSAAICGGAQTTISTCSFAGEHSTITGAVNGDTYKLTSSVATDWITVTAGSPTGPVLAFGPQPLTYLNTFTGTIYAHWSTGPTCGTQNSCRTTTVQCVSCAPTVGCTYSTQFGSASINPNGSVTTISTCSFAGEYSTITGAVSGQSLKFTSSVASDWITVTAGSPCGPTLAFGQTPLSFNNTFTGTIYAHWSTGPTCGTQSSCRTTTVQCTSCQPLPPPSNDDCSNATTVSCGQTVNGNTTNATTDAAPFCGTSVDAAPSVWYKIIGNGDLMTVSTCNSGTDYDTKLHLYTGTCTALNCVTGNDDDFTCTTGPGVAGFKSTIQWCSQPGTVYLLRVSGFGTSMGNFQFTLDCLPNATTNDLCTGALPISCNTSVLGSTRCAGVDTGLPFCGTTGGTAGGVWYTFTGNGAFVELNTCSALTNYDTKIHVFSGSCNNLTCVAGNDDYFSTTETCAFSGLNSIVQFCSQPGVQYYVLVHGFSTAVGEFELNMVCNTPLTVEAGACQTRFVGYTGPGAPDDTLYICPTIAGGTAPYTVSISPAEEYRCDNGCFAVAPNATTTYTVTVTDANGCSASDNILVQVIQVSGPGSPCATPGNSTKVQICHVPPGNPGNAHTLCVGASAVPAHLAHGDTFGPCGNTCTATNPACAPASCGGTFTVTISGPGFLDETTWSFAGATGGPYAFGSTNSTTVSAPSGGPFTFSIETQGFFNDNIANYTITCNGAVVTSGVITGGQTQSVSGICCGGIVAPKSGSQPQASNFAPAGGIVAFPNPFSDVTTFRFRSASNGVASITIFTLAGKEVAQLFNGKVETQGMYEVPFKAEGLSDGVYLYRFVNAEGKMSMGKVSLIK